MFHAEQAERRGGFTVLSIASLRGCPTWCRPLLAGLGGEDDDHAFWTFFQVLAATPLSLAAVAFAVVIPTAAMAGRGDSTIYEQRYPFDQPMHGYEGVASSRKYCTYKRDPKRQCKQVRGVERCKVVGWELEQTCY